jgi:hypothetical protein
MSVITQKNPGRERPGVETVSMLFLLYLVGG